MIAQTKAFNVYSEIVFIVGREPIYMYHVYMWPSVLSLH